MRSNSASARALAATAADLVDRVALAACASGPRRLVAMTVRLETEPDALAWLAAATGMRAYWCDGGHWIAGLGVAAAVRAAGAERFERAGRALRALAADAVVDGALARRPLLLGGFSFDERIGRGWRGFPPLRLVAPRTTLERVAGGTLLTITVRAGGGADVAPQLRAVRQDLRQLARGRMPRSAQPSARVQRHMPADDVWLDAVARAAACVSAGRLRKVVLARALLVRAPSPIDPAATVARLRAAHPRARVFWLAIAGASFVGATPEWLVRTRGREFRSVALAGSLAAGLPGRTLLASRKDRVEHRIVVDETLARLAPLCDRIAARAEPVVTSIGYIQHLRTPITGRLREHIGALALAGRLHPTPAIAGTPRDTALTLIRALEPIDRGWYGGGVGWVDGSGDGEFAVAIRSALVRGATAHVFAGAGIVAASAPLAELEETRAKLVPVLRALGAAA